MPKLPFAPNAAAVTPHLELTPEQLQAMLEALPLSQEGLLAGCDCAAQGKVMPCVHVREAAHDPMLALIRQAEQRSGRPGLHNLAEAAELASDLERLHRYMPSHRPMSPTDSEPGSPQKRRVLRERLKRHESLDRPGDKRHEPARLPGEGLAGSAWQDDDEDEL